MQLLNFDQNFLDTLWKYPVADNDSSFDIRKFIFEQAKAGNMFYTYQSITDKPIIQVDSYFDDSFVDYENLGTLFMQLFIQSNYNLRQFIDIESFNIITDYNFDKSFKRPTIIVDRSKLFRYSDLDLLMLKFFYPVQKFELTEFNELYWRVGKNNYHISFDNVIVPVGSIDSETLKHLKEALADKLNIGIDKVIDIDYAHIIVRFHTIGKEYSLIFPKSIFGFNQYKLILKLLQEFAKRQNDTFFTFEEGRLIYVQYNSNITYNFSLYQIATNDSDKIKYIDYDYQYDVYRRQYDLNTTYILPGVELNNEPDSSVVSEQVFYNITDSPFKESFKQPVKFQNPISNIATYTYFENDITIANELHIAESVLYVNLGVNPDNGMQRFLVITKPYEINDQMFQDIYVKEINLNFRAIDYDSTINQNILFAITIINPEYADDLNLNRVQVKDFLNIQMHIWNIEPKDMESIENELDSLKYTGYQEQLKAIKYLLDTYQSAQTFDMNSKSVVSLNYVSSVQTDNKVQLYPNFDTTIEFAGYIDSNEFMLIEPSLLYEFFNDVKDTDSMVNFLKTKIRPFNFERDFERYRINKNTLFKLSTYNLKYLSTNLKTNSLLYKRYWTQFEISSKYPKIMLDRFKSLFLTPRYEIESGKYIVDFRKLNKQSLFTISADEFVKVLLDISSDTTDELSEYFNIQTNQIVIDRTDWNILDDIEFSFISLAPEYQLTIYYPLYLKTQYVKNLNDQNSYIYQRLQSNPVVGSIKVSISKDTGVISNVMVNLYSLPKGWVLFENKYLDVYNWIQKFIVSCIGYKVGSKVDSQNINDIVERYIKLGGYKAPNGYQIVYPVIEPTNIAFLNDIYPIVLTNANSLTNDNS